MPGEGVVRVVPVGIELTIVRAFEVCALSEHILCGSFHWHALDAVAHVFGEGEHDGDGYSLDTLESAQVGVSDYSAQRPYSPMKHEKLVVFISSSVPCLLHTRWSRP